MKDIKLLYNKNMNMNNYTLCQVHPATLDVDDTSLVACLHTVIMAISNEVTVDGFEMEELEFILNYIACQ